MTRQTDYGRVQRLFPPGGHLLGQGLSYQFDLLISITGAATALAQLDRYKPMHIRVLQCLHEAAGPAFTARLPAWCIALEQLGEPQRETLFADTTWPGKEDRLRQPSGGVGARQSGLNPFVPYQGR